MELNETELRQMGGRVVDFITRYLLTMHERPVMPPSITPEGLRALLDEPLPWAAQGAAGALDDFERKVAANAVGVGHPRFFAWVRSSPVAAAIYAEALAAALNNSVAVWEGAPSGTEVERRVVEWFKEMSGYPSGAAGLLTSGGSIANLTGLLAARTALDPHSRFEGLAGKPPMTVYATREAHLSVRKAVEMMGIGRRCLREVEMDAELRMSPGDLRRRIAEDRAAGLRPLAVVATLGTTNTGACDDLAALGEVCRALGVWLHVDGAYGGWARLVPGRRRLAHGLEQADSFVLDPHKGLMMPYEAGCILVKNPEILYQTFASHAEYLPNSRFDDPAAPFHFRDYGPQLSRGFRALKIYLALKTYGVQAFAGEIARQYALCDQMAARICAAADFELLAPAPLGTVAFRYAGAGTADEDALNQVNRAILARLRARGNLFMAGTQVGGRVALRLCFLSYRTQEADLDFVLGEIREAGEAA
jgi:glutamate/tyrosine decarboxylase-like PLP-dependent enzyme